MSIEKINVEKFLELANHHPVLDSRSPGEYRHAFIPGAYSLPLFTDEERKIVGTAYKQQSREAAIKIGLDLFGVKMRKMVEEVETLLAERWPMAGKDITNERQSSRIVLIHCWRGGMRSAAVAWLLDLYGFKVYTLGGGYKAFRNWVLDQFKKEYRFKILGGYTGSGKTMVLKELKLSAQPVIDLEELANHKGSAFGALGEKPQPSQEMFENMLAIALYQGANKNTKISEDISSKIADHTSEIWLEDESQRIGQLLIPHPVWKSMRVSPVFFLDIPFEERLNYIVNLYGGYRKDELVNAIMRIQKRLGGLETKTAISFLLENKTKECFSLLLTYYDRLYKKGLHNRENFDKLLNIIPYDSVDIKNRTAKLQLQKAHQL